MTLTKKAFTRWLREQKPGRRFRLGTGNEPILQWACDYDARGWDWLSAVGFICFKHLFPAGSRVVSAEWLFYKRHPGRKRKVEASAGEGGKG